MKSTITTMFLAIIVLTSFASANPFNNGWAEQIDRPDNSCTWTRPSTDYRPAREFKGIMGRMSDGSYECFIPGKSWSQREFERLNLLKV